MTNKLKTLAYATIIAGIALASTYAERAPAMLTVDQAVEAALTNNLAVKSAATQERIKKRANEFSFNKFYPSISGSATTLKLNAPDTSSKTIAVGATSAPSVYDYVYNYVPEAENIALALTVQEVFSPVYISLMNQAAIDYQESTIEKSKAEKQITAAVRKFFYQLIVQSQAIELTQARLDNANERLRQAKIAFDLGQGSELNYHYAKANVAGLIPDLRSMKTSKKHALNKFQEILGFDKRDDMQLIGSLDDSEKISLDVRAINGERFDVSESQISIRKLKNALRIQGMAFLPNLILQYTADPTINGPSSETIHDSENWHQTNGAISVTLAWNVTGFIPGSETQIRLAELKDELSLAKESAETTAKNALDDVENQQSMIDDSLSKIESLKEVIAETKRSYDLTDAAYKAGMGRYLDLQSAELALQSSQLQLLNERLNLMSLAYDFEAKYNGQN